MTSPRIIITRPAQQATELVALLAERGLEGISVPTVEIEPAEAIEALDGALSSLDGADWLVVTSANGATAVVERLAAGAWQLPAATRIAAVGPATAEALRAGGLPVHHVPERYLTVAIADGLGPVAGRRIVLARADSATPDLREVLSTRGARVEEVVAYRTVEGPESSRPALRAALRDRLDGITFSSGSTVRGMAALLAPLSAEMTERARSLTAFCIGPVTAEVARRHGWSIAAVATDHTARDLADVVATHFVAPEASRG
jgi:uroporphyrinogen-III synthase